MVETQSQILTLEEFLGSNDQENKVFESQVWKKADGTPGRMIYRMATVGDRERARRAAKRGKNFDNATYGVKIIALCMVDPKIPEIEIERMKSKNGQEMDRLLTAVLGETEDDPT